MPPQLHSSVEVFEFYLESIGFEFARLIELEAQTAEPALAEGSVEGEVAAPQHKPGSPVALLRVMAEYLIEITEQQASCPECAFCALLGGRPWNPAQED
jgi:hypothetical protein